MVNIQKIGNDKIKIDGIEISIKDYNDRDGWYKDEEFALKNEYKEIAKEVLIGESKLRPGKDGSNSDDYYSPEEYLKEMEKVKKVNCNRYHEIHKIYNEKIIPAEGTSSTSILNGDDEKKNKKHCRI